MPVPRASGKIAWAVCLCLVGGLMLPGMSHAATAQAIDAGADKALNQFKSQVKGAGVFLRDAKGYLVFPEVIQAGIGIGGQYGEGVLRIGGASKAYYSITSGSIWFHRVSARSTAKVDPHRVFTEPSASERPTPHELHALRIGCGF
jgi:lipid-binding SYLF domain-containing protein